MVDIGRVLIQISKDYLAGLIVGFAIAFFSQDAISAPERSEILGLLQGYEWRLSPEAFSQFPADTYVTLIAIAGDDAEVAYIRGRARTALSLYRNDTVWQFFSDLIVDADVAVERRRATESICQLFLSSKPDPLKVNLVPLLDSNDIHLRTKAARCLGQINKAEPDAELESALLGYRDRISESWERRAAGFGESKNQ